jgi:hypothetical protein
MTRRGGRGMYRAARALAALFLAAGIALLIARAAGLIASSFGGTLVTVGMLFALVAVAMRREGGSGD